MTRYIRDVSWPVRKFREICLGVSTKADMSPRPGPQPVLPEASFTKISANYYYLKDARRDSAPPLVITSGQKLIGGDSTVKSEPPKPGQIRPGKTYNWERVD